MDSISFTRNLKRLSKCLSVSEWNCKLRTIINDGYTQRALLIFRQMKQLGVDPDKLTFPLLAKACGKLSNFRYAQMIHTHVVKSVLMADIFVQTAMVDMYVKCDQSDFALQLFEKMPERDVASWNVMIMGFAHLGLVEKVLGFFDRMRNVGFQPDAITVMGLTLLGSNAQNLNLVKAMHGCGIQFGMDVDVSVANTWIAAYAKCNDLDSSQAVFYGIPVVLRSVVSWNSMIAGYAFQELFIEAISIYQNMSHHGCRPDLSTMVSLISSCARPCALLQACLKGLGSLGLL